ncbi:unnamed protein product [Protopolystoma xenopodis]|uniref:Uncharacterized protein n=1 Tax=Protopolystoma xenopodis TaxID=117903 RepID=A0A448WDM8_9PLAT|nr:unnamed protein product [Protopolystoma xenopodis]
MVAPGVGLWTYVSPAMKSVSSVSLANLCARPQFAKEPEVNSLTNFSPKVCVITSFCLGTSTYAPSSYLTPSQLITCLFTWPSLHLDFMQLLIRLGPLIRISLIALKICCLS